MTGAVFENAEAMTQDLLSGTVVIDVTSEVAGPFAARMLADAGAYCLKVEPPKGDPTRAWGPHFGGAAEKNKSATFAAFNHGKSSIIVDLETSDGHSELGDLLDTADILIEDGQLEVELLLDQHPHLVIVSVTPYGRSGLNAGRPATDIVAYAFGGAMSSTGLPEREPYWLGGSLIQAQAGNVAACAAVAGLCTVDQTGRGQILDVSWVEAELSSMDRAAFFALTYSFTRVNAVRQTRPRFPLPMGVMPCADGHVVVSTYGWHIGNMLDAIASPRLDQLLRETPGNVWRPENKAIIIDEVLGWLKQRNRIEASRIAQNHGWCVTPVNDLLELERDPWLSSSNALEMVEILPDLKATVPGPAYRVAGGARFRGPAPRLGQHGDLPAMRPRQRSTGDIGSSPATNLAQPLTGARVLDLSVVLSGPFATLILADLGAEVIQIESCQHYPSTSNGPRKVSEKAFQYGDNIGRGYVDSYPGPRPWRRRAPGNLISRNKLSMTVDLTRDEGREIFLRLCEQSDCVMENNQPTTLSKLGLDWPVLRERNPRLVLVRMPPLECQGEGSLLRGVGSNFEGIAGLMSFRGYSNLTPEEVQPSYRMDAATGPTAALVAMMALRRARSTGIGCEVVVSQTVNLLHHAADVLLEAQVTGQSPPRMGNRHHRMAPHGCYQAADRDDWVVIACRDDEDWIRLKEAMGHPKWSTSARFDSLAGRIASAEELDAVISQWTGERPAGYLESILVRFGIPATHVRREVDKFADPHLRSRQFFRTLSDSEIGSREYPGHLWKSSAGEMRWDRPAPRLGQDNAYVYRSVLGCSDEEIAHLTADGHIGDRYDFEVNE